MRLATFVSTSLVFGDAVAQTGFSRYTDSRGIQFWETSIDTHVVSGATARWGLALPPASMANLVDEYIAHLVVPRPANGTWMGMTHSSGMTNNLLLLTWIDGTKVRTDFRYATGYTAPEEYNGTAKLSPIASSVNSTHYELTYRCQNCWSWTFQGQSGSQRPGTDSTAVQRIGWAQATQAPVNPSVQTATIEQHAQADIFALSVASARNAAYTSWTTFATAPATTTTKTISSSTTTTTSSATSTCKAASIGPYDYIVVGAGAAGIPLAAKLAEKGKSVVLVERGGPSSGRWGGTAGPSWVKGTNLTRFDIPGLDNQIYVDSQGIFCPEYSVRAGCILGGGTAVNAGLWWKPHSKDYDLFPTGWKASDMKSATDRLFSKIPSNDHPSTDGIIYYPEGYQVLSNVLSLNGWRSVVANNEPDSKQMTYSHPEHMFIRGERGGPMATYLVEASARSNFKLVMNTAVTRVVRQGTKITGVEVDGSPCSIISLKSGGKVILSAGAFGTPKILFRSGIGPKDQLAIVQQTEGSRMPASTQWILLPVGSNLNDHASTDIVFQHPSVKYYDFYGAYNNPIPADRDSYLKNRTGILAQSAPNLALTAWHEVTGSDNKARQIQFQARAEGAMGISNNNSITITQYLGRGATSRGRAVITSSLGMTVDTVPYFRDSVDLEVAVNSMQSMLDILHNQKDIKVVYPAPGVSAAQLFDNTANTTAARSGNHWMGTCKMGTDSGLAGGTSVVGADAKVFGTDNLYVVDASIIPGIVSANPSALIASLAEKASEKL